MSNGNGASYEDETGELMQLAIRIATIQALMSIEGEYGEKYGRLRAATHRLVDRFASELERQQPLASGWAAGS